MRKEPRGGSVFYDGRRIYPNGYQLQSFAERGTDFTLDPTFEWNRNVQLTAFGEVIGEIEMFDAPDRVKARINAIIEDMRCRLKP